MCIKEGDKIKLSIAVWNDSLFLDSLGVMDYSLLVGLDKDKSELVVGIIGTSSLSLLPVAAAVTDREILMRDSSSVCVVRCAQTTCASTRWTSGWRN
jgi:hypothetical protein